MTTNPERDVVERLLPCPFCGQAAEYFERYRGLWNVRCTNDDCHVGFDPTHRDHADCARVWNRRTAAIAALTASQEPLRRALGRDTLADLIIGDEDATSDEIRAAYALADKILLSLNPGVGHD